MYRFTLLSITALIAVMLGATGISAVSQRALPGDSLYTVKTSLEEAQISATSDVAAKARLNMEFAQKRLAEIQALADTQRFEDFALVTPNMEATLTETAQQVQEISQLDPTTGATLNQELATIVAQQTQIYGMLNLIASSISTPEIQSAVSDNTSVTGNVNEPNDDNGNDGTEIEDESGDDNGDDGTEVEDESNDDNGDDGSEIEDESGDDQGNDNESENENENDEDHGNETESGDDSGN